MCVCLCFVRDVFRECCCLCEREKRGRRPGLLSTFVLGVCEEGEREREGEREKERGFGVGEAVWQARCYLRNTVCGKVLTRSGSRGYYDGYGW